MLTSCTALDHKKSIDEVDRLSWALAAAEDRQFNDSQVAAYAMDPNVEDTPEIARAKLAEAAQADMDAVTGTFAKATDYDKTSSLFRGAIKASKAGIQGGNQVVEIQGKGWALCKKNEAAPQPGLQLFRNCARSDPLSSRCRRVRCA
ncbi:MAG: hypothetical protein HOA30_14180 [Rhodospirillaceae bacterium]|nr:hypothetical protein [Rhodospirillaceae bacterium]